MTSGIRRRRGLAGPGRGPLSNRPFRLLIVGQSVSNIGNYTFTIAFPWLLLSRHDGVGMLGTVVAGAGLARVGAIPFGGWLADRLGSWRVMLWSDCSQIGFAAALAVFAFTLPPSLAWVLPLEVCAGFSGGLLIPSSLSVVPALLPEEQVGRGLAVFTGGLQVAGVVGPALGGVLVALVGAPSALAIDAGSYVVSTLSLLGIRNSLSALDAEAKAQADGAAPKGEPPTAIERTDEVPFGLFARKARLLHVLLVISVAFYLTYPGMEQVALPTLAHQDFGASGLGALLMLQAVGSLLGTVLASRNAHVRAVPYLQAGLLAAFGLALALVPYAGGLPGALAAMSVFAVAVGWQGIGMVTLLQTWTPGHLLGRTMGALMTVTQGLGPVSTILITVVVRGHGPGPCFVLAGAASVAAALGAVGSRTFRGYRLGDKFTLPGAPTPSTCPKPAP